MPEPKSPFKRVRRRFDREGLRAVCELHETDFPERYGMEVVRDPGERWWGYDYPPFHAFKDNGSDILAVAHLDTVVDHRQRKAAFVDTEAGPVVYSGALDDRLGAYTILELLPELGVEVDVLLTTGEESGNSTAQHFRAEKEYRWMVEFDRGGTDVVMYQYEDEETIALVEGCGAKVGFGSFSDIAFLEHLEVKGFNWGVGYRDYHSVRGHAFLEDYWMMIGQFLKFHAANSGLYLPHERQAAGYGSGLWSSHGNDNYGNADWWDDEVCDKCLECGNANDLFESSSPICKDCAQDGVLRDYYRLEDDLVSEDFNIVNARLLG